MNLREYPKYRDEIQAESLDRRNGQRGSSHWSRGQLSRRCTAINLRLVELIGLFAHTVMQRIGRLEQDPNKGGKPMRDLFERVIVEISHTITPTVLATLVVPTRVMILGQAAESREPAQATPQTFSMDHADAHDSLDAIESGRARRRDHVKLDIHRLDRSTTWSQRREQKAN